jgi:DNA-binding NarL/FixJ family response regulator
LGDDVKTSIRRREQEPGSPARQRVVVVDDHPVFREGLMQILRAEPDLEVCGQAGDAEHALKVVRQTKPGLVLVDLTLPGKSGLELIKELRATKQKVKLLVVSMHDEALYANRVLRAGGDGYVMKDEGPEEIVQAIHDVLNGHIYVSERVVQNRRAAVPAKATGRKERALDRLSDAELEVLELLGQGHTKAEIARKMRISAREAVSSCRRIRRKLDLKNDHELIRYGVCWVESGK